MIGMAFNFLYYGRAQDQHKKILPLVRQQLNLLEDEEADDGDRQQIKQKLDRDVEKYPCTSDSGESPLFLSCSYCYCDVFEPAFQSDP